MRIMQQNRKTKLIGKKQQLLEARLDALVTGGPPAGSGGHDGGTGGPTGSSTPPPTPSATPAGSVPAPPATNNISPAGAAPEGKVGVVPPAGNLHVPGDWRVNPQTGTNGKPLTQNALLPPQAMAMETHNPQPSTSAAGMSQQGETPAAGPLAHLPRSKPPRKNRAHRVGLARPTSPSGAGARSLTPQQQLAEEAAQSIIDLSRVSPDSPEFAKAEGTVVTKLNAFADTDRGSGWPSAGASPGPCSTA